MQAFPGSGPRVQVSNAGGFDPIWRKLGGELYYRHSRDMMAVSIDGSKELQFSAPRKLWDGDYSDGAASSCGMPGVSSSNYDVTPDGQRFLMVRDEDSRIAGTRIVVVLNWSSELRQGAAQSTVAHR